jgi:uncharacterized damage-inducible protein DinB
MAGETLPRDKNELLQRIAAARAALASAIGVLSDEQFVAPGPQDGWSVKDHLAHLAVWERGIAALLGRRPRYEAMGLDLETYLGNDEESLNAIIYGRNKDRPPAEVRGALEEAERALDTALAPLADADLFRTYSHYQPDEPGEDSGAPVLGWIADNSYEHYAEHQAWIETLVRYTAGGE